MGNIATSGALKYEAGDFISDSIPVAAYSNYISGAESTLNVATRFNWSDAYATLNDDVKFVLHATVAKLGAIDVLKYDMSGANIVEMENRIIVLRDGVLRNISILRDKKVEDFINGA